MEALLTPGPAWVGLAIGILVASGLWMVLPETMDRASICGWVVGGGFVGGLLWAVARERKRNEKSDFALTLMPRVRSNIEFAAGKLILAIQKEWTAEAGEPIAIESEEVMNRAHLLLQVAKTGNLQGVLEGRSLHEFLGRAWLKSHVRVIAYVEALASVGHVSI